jgi:hypothetical protein
MTQFGNNDPKKNSVKLENFLYSKQSKKNRLRITVGGDRLEYDGETATSTVDITTLKVLINSTLSTKDAKMIIMYIKNYYLVAPLPMYEFMRLPISILPDEIIGKCGLKKLAVDGWVYLEIRKGMYSLKLAGILANQLLQKRLKSFGYHPARHTPVLWLHTTKPTAFSLVVDYVAVKYVADDDAHHLRNALLRNYEITTDWGGTVYSGITLKWDYEKRTCDISMPGYVNNVLNKFQHDSPKTPQHTKSKYVTPVYGAKTQYGTRDETPLLSAKNCTTIQKITGSILYYSRAVYPRVRMPLNDISMEQTTETEKTQTSAGQDLDYLVTRPDATIRCYASDMILHIQSEASYL